MIITSASDVDRELAMADDARIPSARASAAAATLTLRAARDSGYAVRVSERDKAELVKTPPDELLGEPPVVARLVVEIRSDGSRTIARGALEDTELGERVAVQAEGRTPFDLALSLGRALLSAPSFARQAARALLTSRKPK